MTTTPPKRRAPARKPRAAMAPAEAIAEIVGDVSLDLFPADVSAASLASAEAPASAPAPVSSGSPSALTAEVKPAVAKAPKAPKAAAPKAKAAKTEAAKTEAGKAAAPSKRRSSKSSAPADSTDAELDAAPSSGADAAMALEAPIAQTPSSASRDESAPGATATGAEVSAISQAFDAGDAADDAVPTRAQKRPDKPRSGRSAASTPEPSPEPSLAPSPAVLPASLMPESIDDAVEDIFQALMSDEDDGFAADAALDAAVGGPVPADVAPAAPAVPKPERNRKPARKGRQPASERTEDHRDEEPSQPADGRADDRAYERADDRVYEQRARYSQSDDSFVDEDTSPDAFAAHEAPEALEDESPADPTPSRNRRQPRRMATAAANADPDAPQLPLCFTLGPREDDTVFGDYELRDAETGGTFRLRLLGRSLWRCDCAGYLAQGDCEHGEELMALFTDEQFDTLEGGWPAREAEVWLVPGDERRLQWIAGNDVPAALRDQPGLDERHRRDAELSQGWLQSLVAQARAAGVPLRVDAPVWPQLAWGRDAQARVSRLEAFLADGAAAQALLKDTLSPHQWEAALFAVCAGRALVADDLGLGQRGAAIAAIRLWDHLFGASPALVIAPAAAHAAWQRDLSRWLGEGASAVTVAEAPTARHAPALLVVDGIDLMDESRLETLRALEARTGAQLLLIAHQEPLGQPALAQWVDWLDSARRGPWARLSALPPDAGKKAVREALEAVILSRRKRELYDRLPACLLTPMWLDAAGSSLPQGPLKQLRQTLERWSSRPFLNSAEQQQLMEALALLPPSSRQALAAKAEAVLAVRRDWVESATPAAGRLLVCSRSETLLDSLAQSPQLRRLPPHRLRAGDTPEQRAATLQAWRDAPAGVLMASDDALAAVPPGLLSQDRVAVIHADLPWQASTLDERVTQACGDDCCGIPAALLLISGSLDAGLSQAHAKGLSFPHWLDAPPTWLDAEDVQALMSVLPALLDGL